LTPLRQRRDARAVSPGTGITVRPQWRCRRRHDMTWCGIMLSIICCSSSP